MQAELKTAGSTSQIVGGRLAPVAGDTTENRQDFSHRGADEKSLLDEVLRRGRGERGGLDWMNRWNERDGEDCGVVLNPNFHSTRAAF